MAERIKHPSLEQVLKIHRAVLKQHGGSDGIRDLGMLESALGAPQATFGGAPVISDVVEVAASYLFYLCRNHPFTDENRRVALTTCVIFLNANGIRCRRDSSDWEAFVLDVAASRIDRKSAVERLRSLLKAQE